MYSSLSSYGYKLGKTQTSRTECENIILDVAPTIISRCFSYRQPTAQQVNDVHTTLARFHMSAGCALTRQSLFPFGRTMLDIKLAVFIVTSISSLRKPDLKQSIYRSPKHSGKFQSSQSG